MSVVQPVPEGAPDADELREVTRRLLVAVGEDPEREGLRETPRRVADSISELTEGYWTTPREVVGDALFEHSGDDLVLVRDIPFYSLCEHHLLPFFGRCHIAYLPQGRVIGLSKLPRLVDVFARRLQLQERLTQEIATAVEEVVRPGGVAVRMEARHLCLEMRGVERLHSSTLTSCYLGALRDDAARRAEFGELVRSKSVDPL
ncbi:MAG: GTP cyclohydrolase I FolE [Candidatus Dormibacteraeota bacterium]|nr:GTP cyclohydrolase I FolE [Candidatus Dormibacteraeota bacterium]